LLDYLFNNDARRIYAYAEDDNIPSQKLCERLGMRKEGLFMEFISFVNNPDGTPHYFEFVVFFMFKILRNSMILRYVDMMN
jgi:RimJ/RimL family protein N-acetyltransferase